MGRKLSNENMIEMEKTDAVFGWGNVDRYSVALSSAMQWSSISEINNDPGENSPNLSSKAILRRVTWHGYTNPKAAEIGTLPAYNVNTHPRLTESS